MMLVVVMAMGCGDGDKVAVDAPIPDAPPDAFGMLDCAGQPLPTTAPDPLTLSGTTYEITSLGAKPLAAVMLSVFVIDETTARETTTSDAQGNFSMSGPTGGVANFGYVEAAATDHTTSYSFGATAAYMNVTNSQVAIVTTGAIGQLAEFAGVTQTPGNAVIQVEAIDCAGTPLPGATFTTTPAGTIVYQKNGLPLGTASMTDTAGVGYVFDVPPGMVTIAAQVGTLTLRSHVVIAFADAPTFTAIQP